MTHMVLTDLVKTYDHVSLTVGDGEFVAVVGPSGCGRTTTLNLIAGLIRGRLHRQPGEDE